MIGIERENLVVYKFGQKFYYVDQGDPSRLFLEHRMQIQDILDSELPGAYSVNIHRLLGNRSRVTTKKIA